MSEPFIGEVRLFSFLTRDNLAGWLPCDGTILQVSDYPALANLLSSKFGGDGNTNFGLPDLRGRVPMGADATSLASTGGTDTVVLTASQVPAHSHQMAASSDKAAALTANMAYPAAVAPDSRGVTAQIYAAAPPEVALAGATVTSTGGGAAHNNIQPSIVLQYCIAYEGLYPQRP